ncbi:GGDEF domain-containing protein [Terriglobus albidus]|uniref:GGDEF domain-containing protein n=1 Tax=Terriglobus albidus TaxID=1592106 RepID=UPI0021DFF5C2|nr:diguanylate cyclase [Terriglobus albidus]
MEKSQRLPIYAIHLRYDRNVMHARQYARDVAALLGFSYQEQVRLATATSELSRNAFRYAGGGTVTFLLTRRQPQILMVVVEDNGPGIPNLDEILDGRYQSMTGLGKGITGTKNLMDHFRITSSRSGTVAEAGKLLPGLQPLYDEAAVLKIAGELIRKSIADPFQELEQRNQELLRALAELREKQTQFVELNRKLEELSLQDPLTGVANRRSFDRGLDREWSGAMRTQQPLALLMIDVDFFKLLNDRHGHRYGDEALMLLAEALQKGLPRSSDLVARYGGEEFAAVLPFTSASEAAEVAARMHAAVAAQKIAHETLIGPFVTISIGAAVCEPPYDESIARLGYGVLVEAADRALYLAKERGRNRTEFGEVVAPA